MIKTYEQFIKEEAIQGQSPIQPEETVTFQDILDKIASTPPPTKDVTEFGIAPEVATVISKLFGTKPEQEVEDDLLKAINAAGQSFSDVLSQLHTIA